MQFAGSAQCRGWAIAARQMVAEEEVDAVVVEHVHRDVTNRHPAREVRDSAQTTTGSRSCIAAALESRDISWNVRRQRTVQQPASGRGVQRRDLRHGGLQKWNHHSCTSLEIMSSPERHPSRIYKRPQGRPAYLSA